MQYPPQGNTTGCVLEVRSVMMMRSRCHRLSRPALSCPIRTWAQRGITGGVVLWEAVCVRAMEWEWGGGQMSSVGGRAPGRVPHHITCLVLGGDKRGDGGGK